MGACKSTTSTAIVHMAVWDTVSCLDADKTRKLIATHNRHSPLGKICADVKGWPPAFQKLLLGSIPQLSGPSDGL